MATNIIENVVKQYSGETTLELVTNEITSAGYELAVMSPDFKTERNIWINDQFSAWDGSHTVLKSLIKRNLNENETGLFVYADTS